jgi:hypothetical protein
VFNDKYGATNDGSGNRNFSLLKFTSLSDISSEVAGLNEIIDEETVLNPLVSSDAIFDNRFDLTSTTYHRFGYGKYLGRPSGIGKTVNIGSTVYNVTSGNFAVSASDYGKSRKQMAFLGVASDKPNFVYEKDHGSGKVQRSIGPESDDCDMMMHFVKNTTDLSAILTDMNSFNGDGGIEDDKIGCVNFEYRVEPKHVTRIRCFPFNVTSLGNNKKGSNAAFSNGVTNADIGCTLTGVTFATQKTSYDANTSAFSVSGAILTSDSEYQVTIDDSAFAYCVSLSSMSIPSCVSMNGNCTFFMNEAVSNPALTTFGTEMYLSANNTTGTRNISAASRNMLPQLTSVTFNNNHIENGGLLSTFCQCRNLKSANIESTDADKTDYTFFECRELSGVELPPTLTSLGSRTFFNCQSLKSVTLDSSITEIAVDAFLSAPRFKANSKTGSTYAYKLKYSPDGDKDYFLAVRLSGNVSAYLTDGSVDKSKVAAEISGCVNAILKNNQTTGSIGVTNAS